MAKILMPKATAVWLIDNTTLTFEQIADFCELHPLEVKGIADGEVAEKHARRRSGRLGRVDPRRDPEGRGRQGLSQLQPCRRRNTPRCPQPKKKGARFTPVSRRKDRPDAIAWFLQAITRKSPTRRSRS